jgi:hypothetical protein
MSKALGTGGDAIPAKTYTGFPPVCIQGTVVLQGIEVLSPEFCLGRFLRKI